MVLGLKNPQLLIAGLSLNICDFGLTDCEQVFVISVPTANSYLSPLVPIRQIVVRFPPVYRHSSNAERVLAFDTINAAAFPHQFYLMHIPFLRPFFLAARGFRCDFYLF
jgi:hypothetical protein